MGLGTKVTLAVLGVLVVLSVLFARSFWWAESPAGKKAAAENMAAFEQLRHDILERHVSLVEAADDSEAVAISDDIAAKVSADARQTIEGLPSSQRAEWTRNPRSLEHSVLMNLGEVARKAGKVALNQELYGWAQALNKGESLSPSREHINYIDQAIINDRNTSPEVRDLLRKKDASASEQGGSPASDATGSR